MHALQETEYAAENSAGTREECREDLEPPCSLGFGVPVRIQSSGSSVVGLVHDIRPRALSIVTKQALTEGSTVSVEFGTVTREGQVISCHPGQGRFEVWVAMPQTTESDLRNADRFPVTREVRIWTAASESQLDAVVADLSAHGIGLMLSTSLEVGENVMVESASHEAFGIVRYCRPLPDGAFQVGLQVFHVMAKDQGLSA